LRRLKDRDNTEMLRYESFWQDFDWLFDRIGAFFDIRITADKRHYLSEKFSLDANRKRAASLPNLWHTDAYKVHGVHIHTGEPGSWRTVLPEWAHATVVEKMKPFCDELGYVD